MSELRQTSFSHAEFTDKNEGEEGVNAYKGIFFPFAFELCGHMDKKLIAYGCDESHGIAPEADSPTAAYTYVTYGQLDFPTMQNLFILVHGSILMNHS